ncbi:amidase family protein [Stenotrophomonas sp. 24(2023)]|uniref:amidase family protein n=1 Tax=Stenotrophomonas sp. 24(2023) TaxID=3068324 RepID=UPI0027DF725D|nr:amidase family protein [Stenotrophomonas sp. 24(2023)]WMJ70613.1 amidase family protein [Stenotrophomonas sp. 24(2023)]
MIPDEFPLAQALQLGCLDAHDQYALVRRGEVSPRELTAAAIVRARHLDPALGALSHVDFDAALDRAGRIERSAPMAGVAWLPKDSLRYPGMPTRGGSRSRTSLPALEAPPFAQRFDRAGLVAIGKSAMPEFGLMGSTEPLLGPVTRNPWQPTHSPGGSSGGAGAALAAGIVPLAHGSDGAGSIRIPASACGVVGLKPGRGTTVAVRGRHAIEDLIVADSLMSRSVRDTAWAFAAAHPQPTLPVDALLRPPGPLRVGIISTSLAGLEPHPAVAAVLDRVATLCVSLGHAVEKTSYPLPADGIWQALHTLWSRLGQDAVELATAQGGDEFATLSLEPWTHGLAQYHRARCGVAELEQAYRIVAELPAAFAAFHQRFDVLLTPTVRTPPPLLGELAPDRDFDSVLPAMFQWISYTPLQNLAGTPAISLPLGQADGLPVGVQFAADRGQEAMLLQLAAQIEQAVPWHDHWPRISVAAALKETY